MVDIYYFDGCPNYEALFHHLKELMVSFGMSDNVELHRITDNENARHERFLGSPTVRVNGRDIEPGAEKRSDYGIKCRLYATPEGLSGIPRDEWLLAALDQKMQ